MCSLFSRENILIQTSLSGGDGGPPQSGEGGQHVLEKKLHYALKKTKKVLEMYDQYHSSFLVSKKLKLENLIERSMEAMGKEADATLLGPDVAELYPQLFSEVEDDDGPRHDFAGRVEGDHLLEMGETASGVTPYGVTPEDDAVSLGSRPASSLSRRSPAHSTEHGTISHQETLLPFANDHLEPMHDPPSDNGLTDSDVLESIRERRFSLLRCSVATPEMWALLLSIGVCSQIEALQLHCLKLVDGCRPVLPPFLRMDTAFQRVVMHSLGSAHMNGVMAVQSVTRSEKNWSGEGLSMRLNVAPIKVRKTEIALLAESLDVDLRYAVDLSSSLASAARMRSSVLNRQERFLESVGVMTTVVEEEGCAAGASTVLSPQPQDGGALTSQNKKPTPPRAGPLQHLLPQEAFQKNFAPYITTRELQLFHRNDVLWRSCGFVEDFVGDEILAAMGHFVDHSVGDTRIRFANIIDGADMDQDVLDHVGAGAAKVLSSQDDFLEGERRREDLLNLLHRNVLRSPGKNLRLQTCQASLAVHYFAEWLRTEIMAADVPADDEPSSPLKKVGKCPVTTLILDNSGLGFQHGGWAQDEPTLLLDLTTRENLTSSFVGRFQTLKTCLEGTGITTEVEGGKGRIPLSDVLRGEQGKLPVVVEFLKKAAEERQKQAEQQRASTVAAAAREEDGRGQPAKKPPIVPAPPISPNDRHLPTTSDPDVLSRVTTTGTSTNLAIREDRLFRFTCRQNIYYGLLAWSEEPANKLAKNVWDRCGKRLFKRIDEADRRGRSGVAAGVKRTLSDARRGEGAGM